MPNFLQKGLGNCGYRQGEAPQPVLYPSTFYMHGWILIIYAQSFQHHIASQAMISPAILVPRKRPSMLKNDPLARIWHNDYTSSAIIQHAEQYSVDVVDVGSKPSNFQELREHQFHFSKSISHQNLPPTSQGLEPPGYRAFYNAYITMHVLDAQLHVKTGDVDPVD